MSLSNGTLAVMMKGMGWTGEWSACGVMLMTAARFLHSMKHGVLHQLGLPLQIIRMDWLREVKRFLFDFLLHLG